MGSDYSFKLTEEDRQAFRDTVDSVTPEDVRQVKEQFASKLDEMQSWIKKSDYVPGFVIPMINNIRLLYWMLCDRDYKLDEVTTSWITAALMYFISPLDAIPDEIPIIGYIDDAQVVAWVCHLLKDDIRRYQEQRAQDPP